MLNPLIYASIAATFFAFLVEETSRSFDRATSAVGVERKIST
jgi:hypothetical protein